MLAAAARRLAVLFAILAAATTLLSLAVGLALGSSAQRSVSLGFVLLGTVLLALGFFVGVRGPVRLVWGEEGRLIGARLADPDERVETINVSGLFIGVGFVLLLVGLALDPRYSLV